MIVMSRAMTTFPASSLRRASMISSTAPHHASSLIAPGPILSVSAGGSLWSITSASKTGLSRESIELVTKKRVEPRVMMRKVGTTRTRSPSSSKAQDANAIGRTGKSGLQASRAPSAQWICAFSRTKSHTRAASVIAAFSPASTRGGRSFPRCQRHACPQPTMASSRIHAQISEVGRKEVNGRCP